MSSTRNSGNPDGENRASPHGRLLAAVNRLYEAFATHQVCVIALRVLANSESLSNQLDASLAQSHDFDPDMRAKDASAYLLKAIETARSQVHSDFVLLRHGTLVSLCGALENLVKVAIGFELSKAEVLPDSVSAVQVRTTVRSYLEAEQDERIEFIIDELIRDKKVTGRSMMERSLNLLIDVMGSGNNAPEFDKAMLSVLDEAFLTRNLIAHSGAIMDRQFLERIGGESNYEIGEHVVLDELALRTYWYAIEHVATTIETRRLI